MGQVCMFVMFAMLVFPFHEVPGRNCFAWALREHGEGLPKSLFYLSMMVAWYFLLCTSFGNECLCMILGLSWVCAWFCFEWSLYVFCMESVLVHFYMVCSCMSLFAFFLLMAWGCPNVKGFAWKGYLCMSFCMVRLLVCLSIMFAWLF